MKIQTDYKQNTNFGLGSGVRISELKKGCTYLILDNPQIRTGLIGTQRLYKDVQHLPDGSTIATWRNLTPGDTMTWHFSPQQSQETLEYLQEIPQKA